MKNIIKYSLLAIFFTAILITACTKEEGDVRLDPKLATTQVLNITSDSATIIGYVIAEGDGFSERGICYDIAASPTIDKNKKAFEKEVKTSTFSVRLGGLAYATKYYARAYAIGDNGTVYGEEVTFTTKPVVPILTTTEITEITGNSAQGGGNVTGSGGADVTARGIVYGIATNPTLANSKTEDGNGTGEFVSMLTGLNGKTMYYVRSYATNSAGTAYGPEVTFSTLVNFPLVLTGTITNITKTSATASGRVSRDGGAAITERGIVWGLNEDPTISDNRIINPSPILGTYTASLDGLNNGTTYHVRAYAINSAGIAYGDDMAFTTLADITILWVVGDYNGWDNSDNAKMILSTVTSSGLAEGYVWLTSGGIKLVTDHSWDDPHTFGDDGSGGLTNPGANIPVATTGYYRIRANLGDLTYSLDKTDWGVIGDATPGSWDTDTNLTYDPDSETWIGAVNLLATGAYKFRANDDWAINYGLNTGDTYLTQDGSNLDSPGTEADYAITLDLSTPNEYTYSTHRWGVIGSSTPGGWDSDQDMTWDAGNGVFTLTVDLVVGEFKFRADDDWAVNFGGDLNALTQDGSNIAFGSNGNYTITLNPWTFKATLTQN